MADAPFTIVALSRYFRLLRADDSFVSQHLAFENAIERAVREGTATGGGTFRIVPPAYEVVVSKAYGILAPAGDTTKPSAPADASGYALNAVSGYLSWSASSDNIAVTGYQVWNGGTPVDTTTDTFYTVTGLSPSTAYTFRVTAYDAAGNHSDYSSDISFTTSANAAPVWSIGAQALTTSVAYNISLLDYCSDADSDPITFSTVSGSFPPGISANYTTKTIGGTPTTVGNYSVVVRASDGITYTDQTISFEVLNADTTAPSVPTDLAGVGEGGERIDLTWTASSDPTVANARTSGLAGYKVYRDGSLRATLGVVTTYADTTVAADTDYSYTISAFDAATPANESAQTAAVVVSTSAFGWTIADTPYTVPGTWLSLTADQEYDVSVHANTTSGSPVWSITTQTKNGVAGSYGFTIDALGVVAIPADLPDPSSTTDTYTVVVDLVDANSAEQDWLARSTAPGVVWAHDFRSSAEVTAFIDEVDPVVSTTVYEPGGGITGGAVVHNIPSNVPATITAMSAVDANTAEVVTSAALDLTVGSDRLRFFSLPAPWDGFNNNESNGVIKSFLVTSVINATTCRISTTPEFNGSYINPVGFAAYSGNNSAIRAQRCRSSRGSWSRPMSALAAGSYGNTSDDPGASNLGMPARTWNPTYSPQRHLRYRRDYYAHADYAARIATWPDWDGSATSDNYRGSDFWVQWRVKISASRWQDSSASIRNSESLKYFAAWVTWRTPLHVLLWYDRNTPNAPYANYPASSGGQVDGYTGAGVAKPFSEGSSMQWGGDYQSSCVWTGVYPANSAACFNIPPDEWVTFLMHVIPGKNVADWGGWPTVSDPALGTGMQLFATTQSRINAQRAAGQAATYLTIFNKTGVNAYPFQYDNWNPSAYSSSEPPPGWNSVLLWTYQNNIPQAYGWTRHFSQVIFKKGSGGTNPTTDGIPCPQV